MKFHNQRAKNNKRNEKFTTLWAPSWSRRDYKAQEEEEAAEHNRREHSTML